MQFTTTLALLIATATASPLLGLNVGGLNVNVASSSALLAVKVGSGTSSTAKASTATITSVPTSTPVSQPVMPSTFSAPVQGSGVLSLENLPAMPAVIDKALSGALGAVIGLCKHTAPLIFHLALACRLLMYILLVSGTCSSDFKCTITVAGSIQSLLVDGDKYSAQSSVSAWCAEGRCYGSADIPLTATAPFVITCDQISGTKACSATISGVARAIFTNGQQLGKFGVSPETSRKHAN